VCLLCSGDISASLSLICLLWRSLAHRLAPRVDGQRVARCTLLDVQSTPCSPCSFRVLSMFPLCRIAFLCSPDLRHALASLHNFKFLWQAARPCHTSHTSHTSQRLNSTTQRLFRPFPRLQPHGSQSSSLDTQPTPVFPVFPRPEVKTCLQTFSKYV
jgi:hypothetical protein